MTQPFCPVEKTECLREFQEIKNIIYIGDINITSVLCLSVQLGKVLDLALLV
jgi:hypothetical protein